MTSEERRSLIETYRAGYSEVAAALDGFPAHQLTAHRDCGCLQGALHAATPFTRRPQDTAAPRVDR